MLPLNHKTVSSSGAPSIQHEFMKWVLNDSELKEHFETIQHTPILQEDCI